MEDIGEKLYELIQAEFEQLTARDVKLIGLSARIECGMATTRDISEYSLRLGTHLRTAIEHNVSADVLPNGRMYYNIADKILDQSLRNNYELVNDVAVRIQEAVDKKQDIHIRPQKAEYPAERVRAAVGAASVPDIDEEKMIRRMGSPAENITAGFADDYMQVNAEFRSKAGMQAYIIRDDHSGCCPWCSKQAGKYAYPDDVPQDVYKRHDNCKCTVEYVTNGRKQNVHTKQQSMISPEGRERMAELSEKGSVRLSPEEAAAAENKALEVMAQKSGRMLTDGAELQAAETRFKFIEAKNLEEAQAYAQQFCESSFMAKNFKGVVDYKGISVENANKINLALTDVYNRVELDKLSGIKTVAPGSALGKKAFKDGADAVFSYDPIQHGIYVNKDILKSEKAFAEYVKRSEDSWNTVMNNIDKLSGSQKDLALVYQNAGRSLVDGATVEGMFTHELGHHAQWTLLDAKTNNSVGSRMNEFAPKISGYANASKSEYLAESFGAYMRGERTLLDPEYVRFVDLKTIDKTAKSGIIESGGKYTVGSEQWFKNQKLRSIQADKAYSDILNADNVKTISESSGLSEEEIIRIKDHIFTKQHIMYDGTSDKFVPDYDMAVAFKRLERGEPEDRDILLLKHELYESQCEEKYSLTASEAHQMANEKYNWQSVIDMLNDGEGEADDLL